jgi:hypothetical protein
MKTRTSDKLKGLKRVYYFVESALPTALVDNMSYTVYNTKPISS